MSNPFKIRKILEAWIDAIYLEDLTNVEIEAAKTLPRQKKDSKQQPQTIWAEDITLVGNQLLIDSSIFDQLKKSYQELQKQGKQEDFQIAVSLPRIYRVENRKRKFKPLFVIPISSLFQGRWRKSGWDLTEFEFQPVIPNLIDLGWLDEERIENLVTREGLLTFLETTFKFPFKTLQDFLDYLPPPREPLEIKRLPYLLRFDYIPYNYNLKKDIKKILKQNNWEWANPRHPAFEYLLSQPRKPPSERLYLGAFPTAPPNPSQVLVLKHFQEHPLTAVIGPAGNGKTTILTFIPALQVVKRAIQLAKTGLDTSNLTLITSTNHRAVTNVLDNLTEKLGHQLFSLPGGRKEFINQQTLVKLQQAIDWLENTEFDQAQWEQTAQQLTQITQNLESLPQQEQKLLRQKEQDLQERETLEQSTSKIQNKIQELQEQLNSTALSSYENYPVDIYQRILPHLEKAVKALPPVDLEKLEKEAKTWWQKLGYFLQQIWQSLTQTTPRQILKRLKEDIDLFVGASSNTPFTLTMPYTRESLEAAFTQVTSDLEKAEQWQNQKQGGISKSLNAFQEQLNKLKEDKALLEKRIANYPTEEFFTRFPQAYHEQQQKLFELSWQYLQQEALRRKKEVINSLSIYLSVIGDGYNADAQGRFARNGAKILRDISLIFPVFTSTLQSVRNLFPYPDLDCIDCTLVDEAGMIPLHQVFPVLVRSKKAVIVGDPLQLEPIIPLSSSLIEQYYENSFQQRGLTDSDFERYSPTSIYTATAYHRAAGATGELGDLGESILLKEHYRCVPSIIRLCQELCQYDLIVKTAEKPSKLGANLIAYPVAGVIENEINLQEIERVEGLISYLLEQGYCLEDIGVISPYRAQVAGLSETLEKFDSNWVKKGVGTVHTFQGGQKPVIIFSTRQCREEDGLRFINQRPNLLYTAISRAQELLIVVGNWEKLKGEGGDLGKVVNFIEQYGEIREL